MKKKENAPPKKKHRRKKERKNEQSLTHSFTSVCEVSWIEKPRLLFGIEFENCGWMWFHRHGSCSTVVASAFYYILTNISCCSFAIASKRSSNWCIFRAVLRLPFAIEWLCYPRALRSNNKHLTSIIFMWVVFIVYEQIVILPFFLPAHIDLIRLLYHPLLLVLRCFHPLTTHIHRNNFRFLCLHHVYFITLFPLPFGCSQIDFDIFIGPQIITWFSTFTSFVQCFDATRCLLRLLYLSFLFSFSLSFTYGVFLSKPLHESKKTTKFAFSILSTSRHCFRFRFGALLLDFILFLWLYFICKIGIMQLLNLNGTRCEYWSRPRIAYYELCYYGLLSTETAITLSILRQQQQQQQQKYNAVHKWK